MEEVSPLSFVEKIEFLSDLTLFEDLGTDDMVKVAAIAKQFRYRKGDVLIHQGDVANRLHIVVNGRVEAVSINNEAVSTRERLYLPRQMFDDVWLFKPEVHPYSIRARQDGIMIIISSDDFLKMLSKDNNRNIVYQLNLSDEARLEFEKSPFAHPERHFRSIKLVPGELVELDTLRSRWLLAFKLFFPLLSLLVVPTAIFFLLPATFENLPPIWTISMALIFVFICLIWVGFQYLDWANDHLIITNKRLVHFEFDLRTFSGRGKDTNINQIQSVEVEIPNIWSKLLNLGTVRVTTAALSVMYFNYLNRPERVEETISTIRAREQSMTAGQFRATMRKSVEDYFQIPETLVSMTEESPPKKDPTPWERYRKRMDEIRPYRYRSEEGDVITYRKHVFALLFEASLPAGIMLLLIIVLFALRFFGLDVYAGVVLLAMVFVGLWLVWRFEDWRNDTFQVTDAYVIDIDRQPFGFGESRKQARLDDIQNVEADRPNIVATLFNFGNVDVATAGANANIVFENVYNPEGIKGDIFRRRNKYEEAQRKKKAESQRKEYSVLLDVFLQEQELNRINRRTPDFEELEEILETPREQQED